MKVRSYILVGLAGSAGYVLGTRDGRERYDQMTRWARKASHDLGIGPAVDDVVSTAQNAAVDLRQTAADRAKGLVQDGAQAVSDGVQTGAHAVSDGIQSVGGTAGPTI